ncbi:MFS transporter [Neobacillus drentensis]|uniref:MFS transporter n=1 Tax=Neobacillus drentensis TaxID=220684 RepID=UPI000826B3B8|nr:MFS transporter [Neobacillus drentensis]
MNQTKVKLWTGQYTSIIISSLVMFAAFYMITSGFPLYVSTISNNPAIAGTLTTTLMTASLITRFFASVIIQKINMKVLLLVALIYFMATIVLIFFKDSIGFLIFIRALQGIGFCLLTNLLFTLSSSMVPSSRLGEGLVFFAMSTSIGTSLGPMIAISYLANYSFKSMLVITLFLMFFSFICSLLIKNDSIRTTASQQTSTNEPFYKYMYDRRVLVPSILIALNYFAISGIVNFMGAFGKEINLGGKISQFFTAQLIAMVIVRSFSGRIFDKYGHKILIIPGAISGVCGLILLSFANSISWVLISGCLFGIAYAVIQPIIQAWALTLVPPEKKVTANSMLLIFMDLGMAIGSVGLGYLAKYVGYGKTFGYSSISMIAILLIYLISSRRNASVK